MPYREWLPSAGLKDYIDAYWMSSTGVESGQTIFPDACADIIMNTGDVPVSVNDEMTLDPGNIYLVGTMSRYSHVVNLPGSSLLGVRFKPGAFNSFYKFPLHEIRDKITGFCDSKILPVLNGKNNIIQLVDRYLQDKKICTDPRLIEVVSQLQQYNGQVSVRDLAKKQHMTVRTLERLVKNNTGITVKEMARIFRFQHALKKLKDHRANSGLLQVAIDAGYYDQAHLTNEIKHFTGGPPSLLLSA